jgi:hypothetical protein
MNQVVVESVVMKAELRDVYPEEIYDEWGDEAIKLSSAVDGREHSDFAELEVMTGRPCDGLTYISDAAVYQVAVFFGAEPVGMQRGTNHYVATRIKARVGRPTGWRWVGLGRLSNIIHCMGMDEVDCPFLT